MFLLLKRVFETYRWFKIMIQLGDLLGTIHYWQTSCLTRICSIFAWNVVANFSRKHPFITGSSAVPKNVLNVATLCYLVLLKKLQRRRIMITTRKCLINQQLCNANMKNVQRCLITNILICKNLWYLAIVVFSENIDFS